MIRMLAGTIVLSSLVAVTGCADPGAEGDACEAAAAKIEACYPDRATVTPSCDPASAAAIADATCEEISAQQGKVDDPYTCFWMPWLCTGGSGSAGGSTASGRSVEVAVEHCGGGPDDLCPYVTGSTCALVTLHDSHGAELSRGFTRDSGRFTFAGLPAAAYELRVHTRTGAVARMSLGDFHTSTGPATQPITLGSSGEAPWARFELIGGAQGEVSQCADLDGGVTVKDTAGHAVDRHVVEWDWLVELETAGTVVERMRPLYIDGSNGQAAKNVVAFRTVRPGTHTIRFVRMAIPSYEQKPNPDYARLRRLYSADHVAAIEMTVHVTDAQRGKTVAIAKTITDPLR